MGLTNENVNIGELCKITSSGISTPLFPQIRDALIQSMMSIYGNDIDVSSASADGQYINMEALILNNIYRVLENLYNNINPNTAASKYLDILCSLSNIKRKSPSYSKAELYVKNISENNQTPESIVCIDNNGITWTWVNNNAITLEADTIYTLEFTCDDIGPIAAYGTGENIASIDVSDIDWDSDNIGDIRIIDGNSNFKTYMASDAILGNNMESDSSLRERRYNFFASNSTTTQSSLESALYALEGIYDVFIYNNTTGSNQLLKDNITVLNHNIYIVLRYKEGVTIADNIIGSIIYNKLTPGVVTQEYLPATGTSGEEHSYEFNLYNGQVTINWKQAESINPTIVINFTTLAGYNSDTAEENIKNELKTYLSNIKLNEQLNAANIQTIVMEADPRNNGISTYYVTNCKINGQDKYNSPYAYYKYTNFEFEIEDPNYTNNITLTIS